MNKIKVMVNGIPGKMASILAEHITRSADIELVLFSLTGAEITQDASVINSKQISLIKPVNRENIINKIKREQGNFISVDYTHPAAVKDNVEFYCKHELPFIMGTTGVDTGFIQRRVADSNICAVAAPNMAKQIVGFQAMMDYAADNFPDMFKSYTLEIKESHQQAKADVSGTAKTMVTYFNRLGIDFSQSDIKSQRDPEIQKAAGVQEEHLKGHAWHTYSMVSQDKSVYFEFTHNVNGRDIYALGAFDAVSYLDEKIKKGTVGRVFTMLDVLMSN